MESTGKAELFTPRSGSATATTGKPLATRRDVAGLSAQAPGLNS